ncbi:ubiquitin carboxyl-terminal hydrolase isozyme L3 [Ambystoma mexicanum]|uniref:ubiquitin carboxyl-terminal hydrolase isozyme L3 n=1 Tax=Ambystoma mexicanum TaxID=8296 RepID=UPI0037E72841
MEPDLLDMVPKPVCAVLLLFPVTETYEEYKAEEESRIRDHGQELSPSLYFMKQTISNACGTIGLIHAVANNKTILTFDSDSALLRFLRESSPMSPEEKALFLEKDESIRVTHESSAQEGQSEAPSIDDKVDLHFITFIQHHGVLYELDGRKPFPINHGPSSSDTLLEDAIEVCKQFMERDPDELRFTVVAFAKS